MATLTYKKQNEQTQIHKVISWKSILHRKIYGEQRRAAFTKLISIVHHPSKYTSSVTICFERLDVVEILEFVIPYEKDIKYTLAKLVLDLGAEGFDWYEGIINANRA